MADTVVERKPGLGKRGNVEQNAKVFHVVQRTVMKLPLFESDEVYDYWIFHLRFHCAEEGLTLLSAIMMSNHYHALVYCEDVTAIQRAFQRLNTGFSRFVYNRIIRNSDYERLFSKNNPYRLFSSAERLFPVQGYGPLFIDTKYLYDNPKHHNSNEIGTRYKHSTFNDMLNGKLNTKEFKIFCNLYGGLYPAQVAKMVCKPLPDFRTAAASVVSNLTLASENQLFKVNPSKDWSEKKELIQQTYQKYDF